MNRNSSWLKLFHKMTSKIPEVRKRDLPSRSNFIWLKGNSNFLWLRGNSNFLWLMGNSNLKDVLRKYHIHFTENYLFRLKNRLMLTQRRFYSLKFAFISSFQELLIAIYIVSRWKVFTAKKMLPSQL